MIGLLPGVGAWGALMAKNGLRAAGMGTPAEPFTPALIPAGPVEPGGDRRLSIPEPEDG